MAITLIKNRQGKIDRFIPEKIKVAISKAVNATHLDEQEEIKANEAIFSRTMDSIKGLDGRDLSIEDVESIIIRTARENGYAQVGNAYESYRDKRKKAREVLHIIESKKGEVDSTDALLLIESADQEHIAPWDMKRIAAQLESETNLSPSFATYIAKEVENIVIDFYERGIRKLNTNDIRGLVDMMLRKDGLENERKQQELLGIPVKNLEKLIFSKSQENANIVVNNPEAVNLGISESILKPYALNNIFSEDVKNAHNSQMVHLHDLGYPQRVYCSSHSLEFIKKYGLNKTLSNLESKSSPTNDAEVLSGHLQTAFASLQSFYAGALGVGFMNILFSSLLNRPAKVVEGTLKGNIKIAPEEKDLEKLIHQGVLSTNPEDENYFEEKSRRVEMREVSPKNFYQVAQMILFSASQNAFSRGGQTLFIDYNIHTGVPGYMKEVPAIGPGGKYIVQMPDGTARMIDDVPRFNNPEDKDDPRNGDADSSQLSGDLKDGKIITYGYLEPTAQEFAKVLLKAWGEGDKDGRQFHFPKCDLHVDTNSFNIPSQREVLDVAGKIASETGAVYFMFDRGDDAVLAQCCRLKTKIEDKTMLKYPEKLRFVGFQNVTINLPQAAYRAVGNGGGLEETLIEVDKAMGIALKAHLQKKDYIQKLLDTDGAPLRGVGRPSDDGKPYVELDKATYIIGLIGLNETVQTLIGKQLHESEEAHEMGKAIIARMYKNIQGFKKETGLTFTIEETPAESTTRKLAKGDRNHKKYGEMAKKVVKGTEKDPYYTNSIHYAPDADVGLVDRIVGQSQYHEMIASGAIIHAYVGERRPDKDYILNVVKNTLEQTRCSQLVFSPTYTECDECGTVMPGEKELCATSDCKNHDSKTVNPETISAVTRVVGYNSRIKNWNGSQKQINEDRKKAEELYAGGEGRDMPWLYNPNGHDKPQVIIYGKEGCTACESVETQVRKELKKSGIENKVDLVVYHMNEYPTEGLQRAASHAVPLDIVPTMVVAGKEDYWKKTTRYSKTKGERSDLIRKEDFMPAIEKAIAEYALSNVENTNN